MSVIIRLQNLPWSANALDIRQYFQGLSIPEGGVHIVGGELGDAFIAFSTDEDARQAFIRNNGKIREVQITLMLSSRTEMQRVIEQARSQSLAAFMQPAPTPAAVPIPAAVPFVPPATVVEVKKESKERDRGRDSRSRRSRSKSRDRKDRDRKDKRYRDRSRSRSRDRKSSRRRDRSRGRSRSRDKERRSRDRRGSNRRSEERSQRDSRKPMPEVWATQPKPLEIIPPAPQPPSLLNAAFPVSLDQAKMTLNNLTMGLQGRGDNGFSPPTNNFSNGNRMNRDSWPQANQSNFVNENLSNSYNDLQGSFQDRFQKNDFQSRNTDNRLEYETVGCCVALEPFYGGYGDVRRFFQGMFIGQNGIKFINDPNGRRTGIVYVRFSNRIMKEEAMDLSGESLNGVTVTVSHVADEEYDEAVDRFLPMNDNSDSRHKSRNISKFFNKASAEPAIKDYSCLVVDDLPTYCKEQDILHMFSQHPLVALTLTTKPKGGYIAYVKFSNADVAKKANDEKSLHVVGGKQVTVKPCKDSEFEEIDKQNAVNLDDKVTKDVGTDCLSVSRLPLKTSDKDIADFFSDIGVIPTKIHLMSNQIGFTGQAYCEFQTTEEATRAAKKHETILGNVSISVVPIKREDMDRVLGTTLPAPTDSVPNESTPEPADHSFPPQHAPNNPNKFAPPPGNFGMRGVGRPFPNRTFGGPRFGPRGPPPRIRFGQQQQQPEHGDEVPPGCTVYIKNLPYKAGTNDILEFFDGYRHTGNVSRRYNPNNTPTDEAKVMFFDPQEATRAVRDLNKCKIWERQIFLRQE